MALAGVGDESKQFEQWTGTAYHVRRRLTATEEAHIGPAIDIRGTDECARRMRAMRPFLPPGWME